MDKRQLPFTYLFLLFETKVFVKERKVCNQENKREDFRRLDSNNCSVSIHFIPELHTTWSDGGFWVGGGGLAWLLGAFNAPPAEAEEANWLLLLLLRGRGLVEFGPETNDEDDAFGVDFLTVILAGLAVAFLSTMGFVELPDADPAAAAGRVDEAFMASSSAIFPRISVRPFGNGGL